MNPGSHCCRYDVFWSISKLEFIHPDSHRMLILPLEAFMIASLVASVPTSTLKSAWDSCGVRRALKLIDRSMASSNPVE